MAAKKGNKYAEKWSGQVVYDLLKDMKDLMEKDKDIRYLSQLLIRYELYDDIWAFWKKKFSLDKENPDRKANDVFRLILLIETNLHFRLLIKSESLRNQSVATLILKNKYNYTERVESFNKNENNNTNRQVRVIIEHEDDFEGEDND